MVIRKPSVTLNGTLRVLVALALMFSPLFARPVTAVVPIIPLSPLSEENEEEKTGEETSINELALGRPDRRVHVPVSCGVLQPPPSSSPVRHSVLPRAAVLDPFRNGLGTPFRC